MSRLKMCAHAPDLQDCREPGCTNQTERRCEVPLRGRLEGTTCSRATCGTHGAEVGGLWHCSSHLRIARREQQAH